MKKSLSRVISIILVCVILLTGCSNGTAPVAENIEKDTPTVVEQKDSRNSETHTTETAILDNDTDTTVTPTIEEDPVSESQTPEPEKSEITKPQNDLGLTDIQYNSIAMLNFLAIVSQEVNASSNSRLLLEDTYNKLLNYPNPGKVDPETKFYLNDILDEIHSYEMIETKRERLDYIYNQNKATAIRAAIPNPIGLLSATASLNLRSVISSVVYMAVDSVSSYKTQNQELDQQYLKDGWELDDKQADTLHASKKAAFNYMVDMANKYQIPGLKTLNIESIDAFVNCKANSNIEQKIQFLTSEESAKQYALLGDYWLELANCYYEKGEYQKVIDSIESYEALGIDIFRKDYKLAETLPAAIISASEIYDEKSYNEYAVNQAKKIIENADVADWGLFYFAALTNVDVYKRSGETAYLSKAYEIIKNNVNNLIAKQNELNAAYLSPIEKRLLELEETKDLKGKEKDAVKEENAKKKEYNDSLEEKRKTELPESYEPLIVNCELLFALASELKISQKEKTSVNEILNNTNNPTFLSKAVSKEYSFDYKFDVEGDSFKKDTIIMPVYALYPNPRIVVTVTDANGGETTFNDWVIKKVDRKDKEYLEYTATFESKTASKQKWETGMKVKVQIYDGNDESHEPVTTNYQAVTDKKLVVLSTIEFEKVSK